MNYWNYSGLSISSPVSRSTSSLRRTTQRKGSISMPSSSTRRRSRGLRTAGTSLSTMDTTWLPSPGRRSRPTVRRMATSLPRSMSSRPSRKDPRII
ncbi:MAG: hypothetical protein [Circoviridae sp.]|nr:MAG: hypothetical protein [Circoviridae sp.]